MLLSPLMAVVFFVAAVVSVPIEFFYRIRQQHAERSLRAKLAAVGRFMPWTEVESKLRAGEGTLLVEHRGLKGPIREWWTEEDLIGSAPLPLPASLQSTLEQGQQLALSEFARTCMRKLADVQSGFARLTTIPVPPRTWLDPQKYVVVDIGGGWRTAIRLITGRNMDIKYPQAKIVTLIVWSDEPILLRGDAEAVFLSLVVKETYL
jgi:hypothetical protein